MNKDFEKGRVSELFNGIANSQIVLNDVSEIDVARSSGLVFDVAKYVGYVEGTGLSHEEAEKLLKAIWQIVVGFVDLGFGSHPVQQAMDNSKYSDRRSNGPVVPSKKSNSGIETTLGATPVRAKREEGIHEPS